MGTALSSFAVQNRGAPAVTGENMSKNHIRRLMASEKVKSGDARSKAMWFAKARCRCQHGHGNKEDIVGTFWSNPSRDTPLITAGIYKSLTNPDVAYVTFFSLTQPASFRYHTPTAAGGSYPGI